MPKEFRVSLVYFGAELSVLSRDSVEFKKQMDTPQAEWDNTIEARFLSAT